MSRIVRVKVRSKSSRKKKKVSRLTRFLYRRFPKTMERLHLANKKLKKSPFLISLLSMTLIALFAAFFSLLFPEFAEVQANLFGQWIRIVLGALTALFPFSLAEILMVAFVLYLFFWLCLLVRSLARKYKHRRIHKKTRRMLWAPLIALLIVFDLFLLTLYPAYYRGDVADAFGISESEISEDDLYASISHLVSEINNDARQNVYLENGQSVMPTSFRQIAKNINESYSSVAQDFYGINASGFPAKPVLLSAPMTYTHISGVYTFFTGEANVNTHYPDFIIPYTIAHEAAHQRGWGKENDSSFLAFVACSKSTNAYIRYSGYLNTLCTVVEGLNAYLAEAQDAAFAERIATNVRGLLSELDESVRGEISAYAAFFAPYRDSRAADLANAVNDSYLKAQGQSDGVDSYQKIVGLVVNYYAEYLA